MLQLVDLYVVDTYTTLVEGDAAALQTFVANGGSLLVLGQAWTWYRQVGGDYIATLPANVLLAPMGIVLVADTVTVRGRDVYVVVEGEGGAAGGLGCGLC